ncbi:MAG: NAD(P)H-dependent oxidoreductase subunit E [Planctomycetes bacterium]|nr:NAD(P)H-dependent oxidoreductase subunit E [Planctomycetota bacterium]
MPKTLKPETVDAIKTLAKRFPQPAGALLTSLRMAEREIGFVDAEVCGLVAECLGMPPAHVWGVFTFYTTFRKETDGKHVLWVCSTLPCALRGSERLYDYLSEKLGIKKDETTKDGLFTLKKAECIGACGTAPCMQVNDDYYENLTPEIIDQVIDDLRANQVPARHVTV